MTYVDEYRSAIGACVICMGMLNVHDIPAIMDAIDRADAVGPILDPTLYREKAQAMHWNRETLKAALPLWELSKRFMEKNK